MDKTVAQAYGVWKEKNMYGKKVMGVERTTFVIDENGKIAKIFTKVKPAGHAAEVLAVLSRSVSQLHDRRARAAFLLRRLVKLRHVRMLRQQFPDGLAQYPHAMAVHDAHAARRRHHRAIQELVDTLDAPPARARRSD